MQFLTFFVIAFFPIASLPSPYLT